MDTTDCPCGRPPLLVKIAPDLTDADRADVAAVALRCKVDGLVVGNTTVTRPQGVSAHPAAAETGGLSGQPLFDLSTDVLRDMYARTGGALPLVACGGVASGRQAYAKLRAGASLVELYSGLVRDRVAEYVCRMYLSRALHVWRASVLSACAAISPVARCCMRGATGPWQHIQACAP